MLADELLELLTATEGATPEDQRHIEDAIRLLRASLGLPPLPLLPYRIIGYTAEECERDMRRMTDGERGCANPEEHMDSNIHRTSHMDVRRA